MPPKYTPQTFDKVTDSGREPYRHLRPGDYWTFISHQKWVKVDGQPVQVHDTFSRRFSDDTPIYNFRVTKVTVSSCPDELATWAYSSKVESVEKP